MTLYIDIENKKLVQSLTSDRTVATPIFMQGDNEPLILHLLEKGDDTLYKEKALVVGTDFLRVAIARFSGYPKSLTYAGGYTLNESGAVEVILPLNTTAIENAVQDNESIPAFLEVEYSNTSGKIVTVLQTACRIKNDLIDNAPSIDLQDQFYDKVYTDEIFSKKSANLSDLVNTATARANLDVYGKSETYNKTETDSQEVLNLKKANNLSDLTNKATSRTNLEVYSKSETDEIFLLDLKKASNLSDLESAATARSNLDVPQKCELSPLGVSGILSQYALSIIGSYGAGLGDDFLTSENKLTFLTTYLAKSKYAVNLFAAYYAEYGSFYPCISANGETLSLGTTYDSSSENYETVEHSLPIAPAIEYGDKIALTIDGRELKLYKGIELVSSGTIPEALTISNPANLLSWNGLKKDIVFSCSMALPLTSAEGISSKIGYSIEDYVNGFYPPKCLLNSRFSYTISTFASDYKISGNYVNGVGGATIGNKYSNLKLTLTVCTYNSTKECSFPNASFSSMGIKYRMKFGVYIPTDNPNVSKVQFRIGSIALSSAATIISKPDNIDNSGFILAKDEWQNIDVTFVTKNTGQAKLYLYKGTSASFKVETETTDAVYLREISSYGLQCIEGFWYGSGDSRVWKNRGGSEYDLLCDGYSLPTDVSKIHAKHFQISAFSNSIYEYFENFPSGMELTQIILRFDANIPDTSEAEDEFYKNIFTINFDGFPVCNELIPALTANVAYNIYPKCGIGSSLNYMEIPPMYACPCGGTIDLIFTKTK